MSNKLKSHPDLYLYQHIEQVERALYSIWSRHSPKTVTERIKKLSAKTALLHDLGKGTRAFQKYIDDPGSYTGDLNEKSHTPLSLMLTLVVARDAEWDELETLVLAAIVRGHHSRLPTIPEKRIGGVDCPEWDLDNFSGGEKARILKKQFNMIDFDSLLKDTGVDLNAATIINELLEDATRAITKTKRFLVKQIISKFFTMSETDAVNFRLKVQLIYSMLLESDKVFLAVSNPEQYLRRESKLWQSKWIDERIGKTDDNTTNRLRQKARCEVVDIINRCPSESIYTLTAPTGIGKTLLAATWAFKMREFCSGAISVIPKIIVVLPFLSVIDQTVKEYKKLLSVGGYDADGEWLLTSHSLADREYADWLEDESVPFFIDTWQSELIITTYDQFLMSLVDPKARYQMRFHNLCDALIILDELQSLPCKLWQPLDKILNGLTRIGNSKILLMSATLPPFVRNAKPLLPNYENYFTQLQRYKLCFNIQGKTSIKEFCEELETRLPKWLEEGKRILITLNTRRSARMARDSLEEVWPFKYSPEVPLHFISADVTPKDRLNKIDSIKEGKPCLVVSTQCIEAGVDIDMDLVIRDFAPLDSLIQIAGRCNREGAGERGEVQIVDLVDEEGKRYSEMIYDPIHLQVTRDIINEQSELLEEDILVFADRYFGELSDKKDTGKIHLQRFARWQDDLSVHEILRGKERRQYTFLVLEQDSSLKEDMAKANSMEDRWKRREAWRRLAGRIARVSVSIFATFNFDPRQIADDYLGHWVLREGYYSADRGLLTEGMTMIL
ncbi:MAG TPA: CRISPR-associated helicase Cas3' [Syntrophaceticus sp.]|jgi:CRISPR-associated endonuclease/helicase Cas3|nr:CRISPR-associated helicase Cas3' [Eubacteriales bacterium]HHY29489.1 CRISPR-associated helicase Cas3' [Syntrophaceticus sp.]